MRFVQRHAQAVECEGAVAQLAAADRIGHGVEHRPRQKLGRRVPAREPRFVVEVPVVETRQDRVHRVGGTADVDNDVVGVQPVAAELHVHDVGRAVEALGGAEHRAGEAVRDHHVAADADAVHDLLYGRL